ncbi:MAG: SGNH/GDSL hydrolase family protein [Myxococcota bacterium]
MIALLACVDDAPPPEEKAEDPAPCFSEVDGANAGFADYASAGATVASHCAGTDHQEIAGVERLVFLGDSVTEGTPPTEETEYYRAVVTREVKERFGDTVDVAECSEWGARTDDLLQDGDPPQILDCFPEVEERRTLVVMTVGGNDVLAFGEELDAGKSDEEVLAMVDESLALLGDALAFLKDPANFPAGADVVLGNVFEFTDATGDLGACPTAEVFGFTGTYPQMLEGYAYINQAYAEMAVDHGVDLAFMHERFCGHGFHHDDPASPCFRGDDAEIWFDNTCIHPNPDGHEELAEMVMAVVDE